MADRFFDSRPFVRTEKVATCSVRMLVWFGFILDLCSKDMTAFIGGWHVELVPYVARFRETFGVNGDLSLGEV